MTPPPASPLALPVGQFFTLQVSALLGILHRILFLLKYRARKSFFTGLTWTMLGLHSNFAAGRGGDEVDDFHHSTVPCRFD